MAGLAFFTVFSFLFCVPAVFAAHHRSDITLSMSSFGTSLYKRLASGNQDNIIYSPFSVFMTLAMTSLGARGDTEQELRTALGRQPLQNIHMYFSSLRNLTAADDQAANLTLRIANALYYDPTQVEILDRFASNMTEYYGAPPQAFQRPNPEQSINDWVGEVTEGAITDFLSPGDITNDTVVMLLNAVFFEASWRTMFNPQYTQGGNFTTLPGAVTQVPLMYVEGRFPLKRVSELDARVLELPYQHEDYGLFILLPNTPNGLTKMENRLNGQILERAVGNMPKERPLRVYLPKFTLRMRKDLIEYLQTLGLTAMFDAQRANFSGMVSDATGVVVSDVLHEALIEVTESGTKAAAATSVSIGTVSIVQSELFRADRPFLFLLRNKAYRFNIFMGRVTNPSQSSSSNS